MIYFVFLIQVTKGGIDRHLRSCKNCTHKTMRCDYVYITHFRVMNTIREL